MAKNNVNKLDSFFKRFYPTYTYKSVESIPYHLIEENNIKLILIDMDNTIINREGIYTQDIKEWISRMKRSGIKVYIFSNSILTKLVQKVAGELKVKYYHNARKPSRKGFREITRLENVLPENTLMVGDQLFTDVWGGNRFGVKTVLVRPISAKERIHTKIKRPFEKIVLKKYAKKEGEA